MYETTTRMLFASGISLKKKKEMPEYHLICILCTFTYLNAFGGSNQGTNDGKFGGLEHLLLDLPARSTGRRNTYIDMVHANHLSGIHKKKYSFVVCFYIVTRNKG